MQIRNSARALIVNEKKQLFLFQYRFENLNNQIIWITPGGGLEDHEAYEEGLIRELYEELGIQIKDVPSCCMVRDATFTKTDGSSLLSHEQYYLIQLSHPTFDFKHWTDEEIRCNLDYRWWSITELKETTETLFANDIGSILEALLDKPNQTFTLK